MAKASKHPLSGEDILRFLRSFEGAAATFAQNEERWTLWLPEMSAGDHPLTPASQVFFPVILRHGQQAIAIRFLYDCSTGKVRYYTSAIPAEIASLPEFENAVSELFRHSLPVEPMRARTLGRGLSVRPRKIDRTSVPRSSESASLADPMEVTGHMRVRELPPAPPMKRLEPPAESELALVPQPALIPAVPAAPAPVPPVPESKRSVRIEIGPRARSVMMSLIFAAAFVALAAIGIYAYLQATEDPGVLHHRMQIEEMRLREGR